MLIRFYSRWSAVAFALLVLILGGGSLFSQEQLPEQLSGSYAADQLRLEVTEEELIWQDTSSPAVTYAGPLHSYDLDLGRVVIDVERAQSGGVDQTSSFSDAFFVFYIRNVTADSFEAYVPNSKSALDEEYITGYDRPKDSWFRIKEFSRTE